MMLDSLLHPQSIYIADLSFKKETRRKEKKKRKTFRHPQSTTRKMV